MKYQIAIPESRLDFILSFLKRYGVTEFIRQEESVNVIKQSRGEAKISFIIDIPDDTFQLIKALLRNNGIRQLTPIVSFGQPPNNPGHRKGIHYPAPRKPGDANPLDEFFGIWDQLEEV
jgi:hypothetical protein